MFAMNLFNKTKNTNHFLSNITKSMISNTPHAIVVIPKISKAASLCFPTPFCPSDI